MEKYLRGDGPNRQGSGMSCYSDGGRFVWGRIDWFVSTNADKMASGSSTDTSLVVNILKYMPETVRFAILRLGKDCNAGGSNSFTDATCSVSGIRDEKKVMMVRNFNKVFKRGIELMNTLNSGDSFKNMEKHDKAAISVLVQFLEEKGMI